MPAKTGAAASGRSPEICAWRSSAMRRSAPSRSMFAEPVAPIPGPASKASFAANASSVPSPPRSSFSGGSPGILASFDRSPPAGSSSFTVRVRRCPCGTSPNRTAKAPP